MYIMYVGCIYIYIYIYMCRLRHTHKKLLEGVGLGVFLLSTLIPTTKAFS